MFDFMTITRALTDENRIRILMALRDREMCVCQVTGFLDLSPSTTSKHLSILKQARLIKSTKRGKWVYYRLADDASNSSMIRETLRWVAASVGDAPAVKEDASRIKAILAREQAMCDSLGSNVESFHSLEIHTFSDTELNAASMEDS